jgi:hypothetical protein
MFGFGSAGDLRSCARWELIDRTQIIPTGLELSVGNAKKP